MAEYPSDRTILVSHHVAEQLRTRTRDRRTIRELIDRIEAWVRCGIESGQSLDHKPKAFRLYNERSKKLPPGQRFVWCGDEPRFGFIVERRTESLDIVKTTLTRSIAV